MEKIVLIDGHSSLNRAYYGIPDLTNSEGLHTNAVYGFMNIMLKILDEEQPEYLAVAFDLKAPTFRHKIYDAYKGTRKPMQEELRQQVPVIKELLSAMKIPLMMLEGFEADDLLGTVSKKAEADGLEVVVVSGDRDLLQLASDHIMIRIPKTKKGGTEIENYKTEDVLEKYSVTPAGIIELKALMGDASDNIPGIPGVGEKTAAKSIGEFGTIENAYEHVEEIRPNKAKESLRDHYDLAVLSKTLATIEIHSPFTLDLDAARIRDLYTPEAFEMCRRLEFKNLLSRFAGSAPADNVRESFSVLSDLAEVSDLFECGKKAEKTGFYILADGGVVYGAALCMDREKTVLVEAGGFLTADYILGGIREIIREGKHSVTLRLKEQLKYLQLDYCDECRVEDASVGAYLLNPLKGDYPYEDIAKDHAGVMLPGRAEIAGKKSISSLMNGDAGEKNAAADYACYQAFTAFTAIDAINEKLAETKMTDLFRLIEMPLVFSLYRMEQEGIRADAAILKNYGEKLAVSIAKLEEEIYELAGESFNINSPKQLGSVLFEKLQLPGSKKTKSGYSTSADILENLAADYPIVEKILEYRQVSKLKSTYADGLAAFIAEDGRIHGTFNQTITATGRISSTEPNLQNIPVRTEMGRLFRKVFIPKEGCVFIDADYSQIELRVLAALSGDPALISAYANGQDIHTLTASQVFHVPFDEVTSLQRRNAKAVNFGIVYGISAFGLSQDLKISRKEATDYIDSYFATYPRIREFLDKAVADAKEKGYITTYYHRRRPVPELTSSNFMQRSFGERVAMNSPIQGTAADIIKIAMNRVDRRLRGENRKARIVLQVHDELLIEAPLDEAEDIKRILKEEMTGASGLAVPMDVDVNTGSDWYEAH